MNIFLDTSSFFKLYFQEDGTSELDAIFLNTGIETIYLSVLATIEFRSIIWRKVRMKEISVEDANVILTSFIKDCSSYFIVSIDESIIEASRQVLDKYGKVGLRSLDAIQLASAISIKNQVSLFKTADTILNELFVAEGLPVILS